jgi:hypothetical protein
MTYLPLLTHMLINGCVARTVTGRCGLIQHKCNKLIMSRPTHRLRNVVRFRESSRVVERLMVSQGVRHNWRVGQAMKNSRLCYIIKAS